MSGLLAGRSVLVTGAAAGVGAGLALAFGSAGARVVLGVRRPEAAQDVADGVGQRGGEALVVRCDVTVRADLEAAVEAAVSAYGGLDAVVHNATSNRSSEPVVLEDADEALWQEHASVSIRALHHLVRSAHPHLAARSGSLLVLTSPSGVEGADPLSFYGVVKGAQRGFLKALAHEWGPDGIRVNGLAPLALTPALDNAYRTNPQLEARLTRWIPLGRVGDSEADIGPAAVFLLSDLARYVTGQTLVVSGGRFTAL